MAGVLESDVIIVGSGVAGLSLALYLDSSISVTLITKSAPDDSAQIRHRAG